MDIIAALKSENIRISNGWRWLIWCGVAGIDAWVVYERKYYARNAQQLITTKDEEEAISYLLYWDED